MIDCQRRIERIGSAEETQISIARLTGPGVTAIVGNGIVDFPDIIHIFGPDNVNNIIRINGYVAVGVSVRSVVEADDYILVDG